MNPRDLTYNDMLLLLRCKVRNHYPGIDEERGRKHFKSTKLKGTA